MAIPARKPGSRRPDEVSCTGTMSNGAQSAAGVATYRTVRELGARSPRSHAAIREPNELVVTYRFARAVDAKVIKFGVMKKCRREFSQTLPC